MKNGRLLREFVTPTFNLRTRRLPRVRVVRHKSSIEPTARFFSTSRIGNQYSGGGIKSNTAASVRELPLGAPFAAD